MNKLLCFQLASFALFQACLAGPLVIKMSPSTLEPTEAAKTTTRRTFDCQQSGDGMFPSPFYCNEFYVCDHGYDHLFNCSAGLYYDPKVKECNWPHLWLQCTCFWWASENHTRASTASWNHNKKTFRLPKEWRRNVLISIRLPSILRLLPGLQSSLQLPR